MMSFVGHMNKHSLLRNTWERMHILIYNISSYSFLHFSALVIYVSYFKINPTCVTVCIENAQYSSYVLFCNTTAN